jgi:mono/diheme cytochrome c family protein
MRQWLSMSLFLLLSTAASLAWGATDSNPAAAAVDADFFERDIRPLLIRHCHECHGDLAEPKGGLKLTSREDVLRGGDSGPAAVAGQPHESLLISAVKYDGLEMPPDGKRLSEAEIARLNEWIQRGMPWPQATTESLARANTLVENQKIAEVKRTFWSFQPVTNPPVPAVSDPAWAKTGIDPFVLAELERRSLSPSAAADKRTLLRRLSFDLVGLPPTPEELDDFLDDDSPAAIERVVDHLLASPHYGERWARHWLDVARYADTKGYVLFQDANFPWSYTYRDYVVRAFNEDLPYDRFLVEQIAADKLPLAGDRRPLTALGFLTLGSGFMNNQQDVIDDRIDVITRGLLGLTVSCARCHDHKFDPIPTRDYYSLYGVLASSVEPTVPPLFEDPPATEAYAAFAAELASRETKLNDYVEKKFGELLAGARTRVAEYLLAGHAQRGKPPTEDFMLLADTDDLNPTMVIRYQVYLERTAKERNPVWALWHTLGAIPADQFAATASATVARVIAEQTVERPLNPLVAGAFLGQPLKELADAAGIYGKLLLGADKLPIATSENNPVLAAVQQAFTGPDAPANLPRNEINVLALLPDRKSQGERTELLTAVEKWRADGAAAPPRAMVLEDLAKPVEPRVFVRGNSANLGETVPRRFLRVLSEGEPPTFSGGSGRLELAQAIADRNNPLTARVLVNRVWLAHFGTPLVSTPSDFGLRSEPPTHPALLDYLAHGFMQHGWSIKWLHREIVLSAAYRQASDDRADCLKVDPENVWLWRMNRRRLDFETTRDNLLAVSGRLDRSLGGPPIKEICAPTATRRTLYGHIDRLNLPGLFRTFDFPNPDATSPERSQTTVPQQALFFMNHPLVQEAAKSVWLRPDVPSSTDAVPRIDRLYRLALSRSPSTEEAAWAAKFVAAGGASDASWSELAQAILATNEFVFID